MSSLRARAALVLLNLTLLSTIVWLVEQGVRRSIDVAVASPLPVEYAVDAGARGPVTDPSKEIGAALDRPLPSDVEPAVVDAGPVVSPLAERFRLLLVSEDRDDPARSTAIVASPAGEQRTVMVGDHLEDHEVVRIGVESVGNDRQAVLVVEHDGERHELRTEGARP